MTVEADLRTFLVGVGAATSQCSTSFTFVGPIRPAKGGYPAAVVAIQEYGGLKPQAYIEGNSRKTFRRNDVQIRVRGSIGGYLTAKNQADAIWLACNRPSVASVSTGSTQYISIEPFQSGPVFMGENDTEQPEFTFTVRMHSIIGT